MIDTLYRCVYHLVHDEARINKLPETRNARLLFIYRSSCRPPPRPPSLCPGDQGIKRGAGLVVGVGATTPKGHHISIQQ